VQRTIARLLAAALTIALIVATAPDTAWAASYDAAKFDAAFLSQVLAHPDDAFDVIVRSAPDAKTKKNDRAQRAGNAILSENGMPRHALSIVGGASGTLSGKQLLKLSRRDDVDFITFDAPIRAAFDPAADSSKAASPGVLEVGAPQVWQTGATGKGVGVAIVDSGVYAHADLAGRVVASVDFTAASPTVSNVPLGDLGGHGTHVAGLVAGDGKASHGVYTGVAPNANIVDVRVIDANGNSNVSIILRGLQWVLANKNTYNIRVVNLSLGATPSGSYKKDVMATAAEVLFFAGVNVVVSAGNSGPTAGTITTPGTDPYVITVGAADDNGTATLGDDLMASFSSRGKTAFDRLSKPDLVAPGRKMVSLRSPGSTLDTQYPDRQVTIDGATSADYYRLSGTSMAAPVVSGTIALMLERNPTLNPQQVKKRLVSTATPVAYGTASDRGAGLLNAYRAVSSIDTSKQYANDRVTDAFAKDMRKFVQGQPIVWRDLLYNGGVDSSGKPWAGITWDGITWDGVTWENVLWDAFTWEGVTWEGVTWESVTWETSEQQSTGALSGTGSGWDPVD